MQVQWLLWFRTFQTFDGAANEERWGSPPVISKLPAAIFSNPTAVPLPAGKKYHLFAGHAWGKDGANHSHVRKMVQKLTSIGFKVWFDDEKLSGDIAKQISQGLDDALVYMAFVNKDYVEKIEVGSDRGGVDWFYYEFNAALFASHGRRNTIVIVCEPALLDEKTWLGQVRKALTSLLFIDYSNESKLQIAAEQVKKQLLEKVPN